MRENKCSIKLKRFSALSVLFFLLSFSPFCFSCFAEVKLTDEEAEQILTEIEESKKELQNAKEDLTQSKEKLENVQKESQEQKTELQDVKGTYEEQKKSYEEQLSEAEKKNKGLKTAVTATSSASVVLTIAVVLPLFDGPENATTNLFLFMVRILSKELLNSIYIKIYFKVTEPPFQMGV